MIKKYFVAIAFIYPLFIMAQNNYEMEKHRPVFHFTPQKNWMNDPNGLLYTNGVYHLFYQHNPFANVWGHMSWGHATSIDLLHWQHKPIALQEENGVMIFSGSAVADVKNTSKFGTPNKPPLVAIYTAHTDTLQTQSLAYSNDDGNTWKKYANNPVINLNKKDFRDPNVFWYEKNNCWIMSVAMPNEHLISFYSSSNLKNWKKLSDFGPLGDTSAVWECPDLMQVPIQGSTEKRWVLFVSMNSTMQYFTGNFNGTNFIADPINEIQRVDYGMDYYAAVTYHNNQYNQPVSIGWMNNWYYANDIPTQPWKSVMSLPRKLFLKKINNQWQLIQQPIDALKKLEHPLKYNTIKDDYGNIVYTNTGKHYLLQTLINTKQQKKSTIQLAAGMDKQLVITYNPTTKQLVVDRSKTNNSFSKAFAERSVKNIPVKNDGDIVLDIYYDNGIVEIFVNNGEATCSLQIFANDNDDRIVLSNNLKQTKIVQIKSTLQ